LERKEGHYRGETGSIFQVSPEKHAMSYVGMSLKETVSVEKNRLFQKVPTMCQVIPPAQHNSPRNSSITVPSHLGKGAVELSTDDQDADVGV
jgi:hypothetical protein